jgi:hypothetical protein
MIGKAALALAAGFVLIQFVPYGHDHANPPVLSEPAWDSTFTRAVARRACFDCHSNQTEWPWYASIAPASWLVQSDVERGRTTLNFSEWKRPQLAVEEAPEEVLEEEMPPPAYKLLHADARLSLAERRKLARGLGMILAGAAVDRTGGEEEQEEGEDTD